MKNEIKDDILIEEPEVVLSIEDILSEQVNKESNAGRWKGGRYDTDKKKEMAAWNTLKKMLRYSGDNNVEVKQRIDNLAVAIQSGILEIRKAEIAEDDSGSRTKGKSKKG